LPPLFFVYITMRSSYLSARENTFEARAIGNLKRIGTAQSLFREGDKDGNRVLDYGELKALGDAGLIDPGLASGEHDGYRYSLELGADPKFIWRAQAHPLNTGIDFHELLIPGLGPTGSRSFAVNQAGVIYYTSVFQQDEPTMPVLPAAEGLSIPRDWHPVGK
jgi:hypothetical protein